LKKKQVTGRICEKGYRNNPLTEEQKSSNREKSRIRVRVEHIFGFITNSMQNGLRLRAIGLARTTGLVGLVNLVYNMARYEQIMRLQLM
jgi:IS5 family transposase